METEYFKVSRLVILILTLLAKDYKLWGHLGLNRILNNNGFFMAIKFTFINNLHRYSFVNE